LNAFDPGQRSRWTPGHGFGVVVKELEHLAKNQPARPSIFYMTRVIQSETNEARSAIDETIREAAVISKFPSKLWKP